jgi:DNA-binding MarR family transcriptional regulator
VRGSPGRRASSCGRASTADPQPPALRVDADFAEEFPGADPLSSEVFVNLCRTGDLLLGELNRRLKAQFDLSPTAGMVLAILDGADGPLTPSTIAERVVVTTASVTSLLDTLERRALLLRRQHPTDRRKILVELTDEGRSVVDRLLPGAHRLETEVMSALSAAERRQLLSSLAKVQASVAAAARQPPDLGDGVRNVPSRIRRT